MFQTIEVLSNALAASSPIILVVAFAVLLICRRANARPDTDEQAVSDQAIESRLTRYCR